MNALLKQVEERERSRREARNQLHTTACQLEDVEDRLRECAVQLEDVLGVAQKSPVFDGRASVASAASTAVTDARDLRERVWQLRTVFERERTTLDAL